jgi:ankyrin repeat protein
VYVKRILRTGTDINMRDCIQRTPLALASIPNHFRTAKYLLDHGADIEAKDAFGATPLLRAVRYGSVETATLLLDYGAIDGWTILHRGALSSNLGIIRLLASQNLWALMPKPKTTSIRLRLSTSLNSTRVRKCWLLSPQY